MATLFAAPAAHADPVADAFSAFKAGEYEKARDIARGAIAVDETVNSLVARKVLVRSLRELGDLDGVLLELENMRGFELLEADEEWVRLQEEAVQALVAERETTSAEVVESEPAEEQDPAPGPEPEAASEPEPEPEAEPEPESEPTADADASGPEAESPPSEATASHTSDAVAFIALGGGFQQLREFSYATVGGEAGARLFGPLWFSVDVQLGLSPRQACSATPLDDAQCTSLLTTVRPGLVVRFEGPVEPHVHAGFVLGIIGPHPTYNPVMPGLEVGGAVEIGKGPVAVRPRAAFRLLAPPVTGDAPLPGAILGVDAVFRLGGRS
ncbi:MAG: hypothetical protein KDA24_28810 [Deltaproteobacteria bacterium]|nr:hypothetical protein [Deltaproteobacteria bacterium]